MESSNREQQEMAQKVYDYAANLMIRKNKSASATKQELVNQGLDEQSAQIVVSRLEKDIKDAKKERSNKDMLFGALWCVGGIIVTVVTYSAASGGGSYVIAWGAIIFGAVQFIKGAVNSK